MLVTITAQAATTGARDLSVEVWSGRTVSHLTATPRDPILRPLQVDWAQDGLHLSTGKTVKELALSGSFRMQANSANRGTDLPEVVAAGKWNLTWQTHGLRLVLTLPSEDYVKAALHGEAAPDEPIASLQAMAIAMRTFALANADRHRAQGFGLCDNTHCQALRLQRVRPEIERAVRETAGETLWFQGQQAHVFYTQHCGGANESAESVWPNEKAPYLAAPHADPYCLRRSSSRWRARIPLTRLNEIFRAEGWHTPFPIETVRVTEETASGRARLMEVRGRGAPATLSASSLRFAIDRALGWNQLRSDWYTVSVSGDALEFAGQGYGHGVGLCQAGAYEMAAEGHSAAEILAFYFPGTRISITPSDQGWRSLPGKGWTLLTTTPNDAFLAEADAAWAKARLLMGETPASPLPKPTLQEFPSTALFRQTTNEPGWVLASTRGTRIFLQPPAVRHTNGSDAHLLLHEFLHVLVEQQAGENTPLWLREGLVETLADPPPESSPMRELPAAALDAALAHPSDSVASRRAHQLAEQRTRLFITRYGMPEVKRFLKKGVPPDLTAR
jgi:stage II sporulation protein D